MTIDVDAIYENGVLKLKEPLDLPEKAEVHVTIKTTSPRGHRWAVSCASCTRRS